MENIILNCTYETLKRNFNNEIYPDDISFETLYRNHLYNRYIGELKNDHIRIQRNLSPLLINDFSIWTFNQMMSPSVLEGIITDQGDRVVIWFKLRKRLWHQMLGIAMIALIALMTILLLFACFGLGTLRVPLYVALLLLIPFYLFGIYVLYIPFCEKIILVGKLKSLER